MILPQMPSSTRLMSISTSWSTTQNAQVDCKRLACFRKAISVSCRDLLQRKTGELESLDALKRQFEEASKHADIDQLGIAPQCGFASTEEGNEITVDEQRRKLELVVQVAEAIWGHV